MVLVFKYYYDDLSNLFPMFRHQIVIKKYNYPVDFKEKYFNDLCSWLNENVGQIKEDWHFTELTSTFYFKTIEDAMAFKLRWW